jgi:hypothetical protein
MSSKSRLQNQRETILDSLDDVRITVIEISQFDYLSEKDKKTIGIPKQKERVVNLNHDSCPLGYKWIDKRTGKIIRTNYDSSD